MWKLRALLAGAVLAWGSPALAVTPYGIFFAPNSTRIDPLFHAMLDNAVEAFRIHDVREIWLHAHTDRAGSAEYNRELSRRRAEAVREELVRRGYSGTFIIEAYGEERPFVATDDGVARAENRRVEIIMRCFHNPQSLVGRDYMRCQR